MSTHLSGLLKASSIVFFITVEPPTSERLRQLESINVQCIFTGVTTDITKIRSSTCEEIYYVGCFQSRLLTKSAAEMLPKPCCSESGHICKKTRP